MNIIHKTKFASKNAYKKAFSLVELMISLILISLISAAFAPVITKKLSKNVTTVSTNTTTTATISSKDICNIFNDKFWENNLCKSCSSVIENCNTCTDKTTCTSCIAGYTLKNNTCVNSKKIEKFEQAHKEFTQGIKKLSTSGYFCNGDFGLKPDCKTQILNDNYLGVRTYFCESFAKVLAAKNVNCNTNEEDVLGIHGSYTLANNFLQCVATGEKVRLKVTSQTILEAKKHFDNICSLNANNAGAEIISANDNIYYEGGPDQFGSRNVSPSDCNKYLTKSIRLRYFTPANEHPANYGDENGEDISYKVFCIDIDGIAYGEEPFGYGVRADGKVLTGARADEWLKK